MGPQDFTVYDMIRRNAQVFRDRPAVIHDKTTLTFRQYLEGVDSLAAGLAGLGLAKGERVSILAQNDPSYLLLYGACAKLGLIAYPINWRLTVEEVGRILERAQPRMMAVDAASQALVPGGPGGKQAIPHFYSLGPDPVEGLESLASLMSGSAAAEPAPVGSDDPFAVIVTAAVDVIPRGAVLTHGNLMASNLMSLALMGLNSEDRYLLALPLYHIAGLGNALAVMHGGGANVVMTRFDAEEAVRLIDTHKVTFVTGFAPIFATLLDAADKAGSNMASLRHASGLETPDAVRRLIEKTGACCWSGFGQSETTGFVSLQRLTDKPGAAGKPAPLCVIKLVDDEDNEVPLGEPGEILVRGPVVMKEYYGQPDVTAHNFRGGWHHTGDLGRFDEEGYLFYAGRKPEKELIKPGGENVYPAEVESVIMEMAGVSGVCVFGVIDPQWGEAIKAVVETKPTEGLTKEKVIDHVGGKIARFKRPRWVEFTDSLPRTAAGEVDRAAVKTTWGDKP